MIDSNNMVVRWLAVLALLGTIAAGLFAGLTYLLEISPSNPAPSGHGEKSVSSQPATSAQPQGLPSSAEPTAAPAQPVRITSPYEEPPIFSLKGTGNIPQGKHLWIFAYAPVAKRYFPQGETDSSNSTTWTVPDVHIGSNDPRNNGHIFTVYALVVDDAANAQIWSFANAHPDEGYSADEWQANYIQFMVSSRQVKLNLA